MRGGLSCLACQKASFAIAAAAAVAHGQPGKLPAAPGVPKAVAARLARPPTASLRSGRRCVAAAAGTASAAMAGERAGLDEDMMLCAGGLVPPLTPDSYKGQHGKVLVVGGCREYTGAPFFAGLSAIRVGADLAHVICTEDAAPVIKGYSPELIVLPFLPPAPPFGAAAPGPGAGQAGWEAARLGDARKWLARVGVVAVGPGLGDDVSVVRLSEAIVSEARAAGLPLLIDGSGLNFLAKNPALVAGYQKCVLTPNLVEFGRLAEGVGLKLNGPIGPQWQEQTAELARALGGPVVVSKGPSDVISDGGSTVECAAPSSLRRAGGQGDVLVGAIAAFMGWAFPKRPPAGSSSGSGRGGGGGSSSSGGGSGGGGVVDPRRLLMAAAYGGAAVVRAASAAAFVERRRSMVAGDIIVHLPAAFEGLFPGK